MAKKSITPVIPTTPQLIKCEDCRNFDGRSYRLEFGCSKGHEPDYHSMMAKESCIDNSPMTHQELIFKRFEFGAWSHGDGELKKKQATVRRTATSLRATMSEFEKFLSSDQAMAIREAASAFDRLGNDIELAAKLAKKYKEEKDAEYARQRQTELDQIAADYFGIAGAAKILDIATDLESFATGTGLDWFRQHCGDNNASFYFNNDLEWAIRDYKSKPDAKTLTKVRTTCAQCFEKLRKNRSFGPYREPVMVDFEAYRVWLADQRELARLIEADDKIVRLNTPKRR